MFKWVVIAFIGVADECFLFFYNIAKNKKEIQL